jgi:hypothetical protein
METFTPVQALSIPFAMMSGSDPNLKCRDFVMMNNPGKAPTHWFDSRNAQTSCTCCSIHSFAANGCEAAPSEPDFSLAGSPCHPFSTQRADRHKAGSVAQHSEYETTMTDVINWLLKFNPKAHMSEQVFGFDLPADKNDPSTPMRRRQLGCSSQAQPSTEHLLFMCDAARLECGFSPEVCCSPGCVDSPLQ